MSSLAAARRTRSSVTRPICITPMKSATRRVWNMGMNFPGLSRTGLYFQEYTVVTYTDYVGDTDTFSIDSGPIGLGANLSTARHRRVAVLVRPPTMPPRARSGAVTRSYTFNPMTCEMSINGVGQGTPAGNKIFRTIWYGNGNDTYDLSIYLDDLDIDLAPGEFSTFSQSQIADLIKPRPRNRAGGRQCRQRPTGEWRYACAD